MVSNGSESVEPRDEMCLIINLAMHVYFINTIIIKTPCRFLTRRILRIAFYITKTRIGKKMYSGAWYDTSSIGLEYTIL